MTGFSEAQLSSGGISGGKPDAGTFFAPDAPASGAEAQPAPAFDEKVHQFWHGRLTAANLANAVVLFMRSPAHRNYEASNCNRINLPQK